MAGVNRITRSPQPQVVFPDMINGVSSSTDILQGDLCVLASNLVRKVTTGDLGTSFLGIAQVTIEDGKIPAPVTTDVAASQAIVSIPGPVAGVVAKLVLKTGDAIAFGAPVYLDGASGAYHVTATQPMSGVAIGYYQGGTIASATAGQQIEVLLRQTLVD